MVSGINFCPLLDVKDAVIVILSIDKHVGRYYFSALKPELIKRNRSEWKGHCMLITPEPVNHKLPRAAPAYSIAHFIICIVVLNEGNNVSQ